MEFAAQTHKGLVRDHNEDSYFTLSENYKPAIFIIADGLGGHKSGEIASRLACSYTAEILERELPESNEPVEIRHILNDAMQRTNVHIYMKSLEDDNFKGMGTTLTVGVLYPESFYLAHVGDTRVYRLRNNDFEQITTDHTYVGEMVATGSLSEDEIKIHPQRHVVTQAVGYPEFLDVDYSHLDRAAGDRFIMSSDGMHGVVDNDVIQNSLSSSLSPDEVCTRLIEQSLEAGAPDNITVITIFV